MLEDLKISFRQLRKSPGFLVTAVLTLALGIGATTAIFTLVDAVLLRSLPVRNPSQLWRVGDKEDCCFNSGLPDYDDKPNDWSLFSYEQYREFRDHTPGFQSLAAFEASGEELAVRRAGTNEPVQPYTGEWVSGNSFDTLGLRPYAGRLLRDSDDTASAPPVAVISYQAWQQQFGRDPHIVGSTYLINGLPVTIVGIAPPGFYSERLSPTPPAFWMPLMVSARFSPTDSNISRADVNWLNIIGRLAPGASVAATQARLNVELQDFLRNPISNVNGPSQWLIPKQYLRLTPGGGGVQRMQQNYRSDLHLLMWISAFVLLIACANLANLMLARSVTHRQPIAIRTALGAPRGRLVQRALIECCLLALIGGMAGLLVAWGGVRMILHLAFQNDPVAISASPSLPVLFFALAASLLTGLLFGVAPAWIAAHADPIEALRGANRSTAHSTLWAQKALVVGQAAISIVLLCAAGFVISSLNRLQHQHFGFETKNRTILMIDPEDAGYRPDQLDSFYRQLHDRLARIPGVTSVAYSLWTPMDGRNRSLTAYVEGQAPPAPGSEENLVSWNRISPDYFKTLGTRIIAGRGFLDSDNRTSRNVAIVDENFVRTILHGKNPIGMHFGEWDSAASNLYEIVGVVEDTQYWGTSEHHPMYFLPAAQWAQVPATTPRAADFNAFVANTHYMWSVSLETRGSVPDLEAQVRRALAEVNPNLMMVRFQPFTQQVSLAFSQQNMIAQLTSLFGGLALVLAAIGLYGVTAYAVAQRTSEIGIRMALGANRTNVLQMVLRSAFLQVGLGVLIGVPGAIFAGRLMASQLFHVSSYDPLVLGSAIAVLAAAALVAAALPARRAAGVEPMEALRGE